MSHPYLLNIYENAAPTYSRCFLIRQQCMNAFATDHQAPHVILKRQTCINITKINMKSSLFVVSGLDSECNINFDNRKI